MMFDFNFPVPHSKALGTKNDFGEYDYSEPVEILCRVEGGSKYIRLPDGQVYDSTRWYMTTSEVKAKDIIEDHYIAQVKVFYDMDCITPLYYEAYV